MPGLYRGDHSLTRPDQALDGQVLGYRRHRGDRPPSPAVTCQVGKSWTVALDGPDRGFGDGLLALTMVRGPGNSGF